MAIYTTSARTGETRTDHLVEFSTKQKAPFIIENAERIINHLMGTFDPDLETSLAYYNGYRNPAKFSAIIDNYGVGNPNKLPFISLMQRHVKALMGFFMQLPFPITVSATDRDSIWQAREEMGTEVVTSLMQTLNQLAQNQWGQPAPAPGAGQQPGPASVDQTALQDIRRKAETYTSRLERFSSVLLDSLVKRLQLKDKAAEMVEKRVVAGRFYYRVWLEETTQLPRFELVPVEELRHLRDKSLGPIRTHRQVLRHRRMLRTDALARWGYAMSDKEKQLVGGKDSAELEGLTWVPLRAGGEIGAPVGRDAQGNPSGVSANGYYLDSIAVRQHGLSSKDGASSLIDVYEGEFVSDSPLDEEDLDDDEASGQGESPFDLITTGTTMHLDRASKPKGERHRQHVYSFVRLGSCIYLNTGRYKYAQRPLHDPSQVYLTYNGCYGERSVILDSVDLQDKSDLLNMHQDNLIALGGVPGVMIDINDIPIFTPGQNIAQRIAEFRGRLKQGLALLDRSQNGRARTTTTADGAFANSGKVDTSFNGQSITAIKEQLAYIEEQASRISGVPRQMQGEIGEREGLGTTNQALASASAVNRPVYSQVLQYLQDACTDLINLSRITAKNNPELIAAIIGTAGARLIGAGAERFPLANFNVHVHDALEEEKTLESLRQAGRDLVSAMAVDPKLMINIASINNVAVLRELLFEGVEDQAANKSAQLEQQNAELQKQVQQLQGQDVEGKQQQLALDTKEVDGNLALGQQKLLLEQQELSQQASTDATELDLEKQRVALEAEQLFFSRQSEEVANS